METHKKINTENKERRKLKKINQLLQSQKRTIKTLINIISSGVGYLPGAGPIKSLGEGIIGKDFVTKRKIQLLEQGLKISAGTSGLSGYYYLLKPYYNGAEPTLDDLSFYATLEALNMILYTLSLLAAGGEQAQKVKHIKQQLYTTLKDPKTIINTKIGHKNNKDKNNKDKNNNNIEDKG